MPSFNEGCQRRGSPEESCSRSESISDLLESPNGSNVSDRGRISESEAGSCTRRPTTGKTVCAAQPVVFISISCVAETEQDVNVWIMGLF